MNKKLKIIVAGALLATTSLSAVISVQAADNKHNSFGVSQMIAFGDSMSDNGGAYRISTELVESEDPAISEGAYIKPGALYWENRYSNGKTAVEVFADKLGVNLTNYAIGGAMSDYHNYSDWMDRIHSTGVLGQIDEYVAGLNGESTDENALYFILVGANDYSKFMDYGLEGTVEGVADRVVENIETAIEKLADAGAEKFFISNSVDLTNVPYEISENRLEAASAFTNRVNDTLPVVLESLEDELNIDIIKYDITATSEKILEHAKQYGLKYLDTAAQPTWPEVGTVAENVDEYLHFDEWHYTRVAHQIFGEAMYKTLKANR